MQIVTHILKLHLADLAQSKFMKVDTIFIGHSHIMYVCGNSITEIDYRDTSSETGRAKNLLQLNVHINVKLDNAE